MHALRRLQAQHLEDTPKTAPQFGPFLLQAVREFYAMPFGQVHELSVASVRKAHCHLHAVALPLHTRRVLLPAQHTCVARKAPKQLGPNDILEVVFCGAAKEIDPRAPL